MSEFIRKNPCAALALAFTLALLPAAPAAAVQFSLLRPAETLPEGALQLQQTVNLREGKNHGDYQAIDWKTWARYGVSDRFDVEGYLILQSIDVEGFDVDGYLPGDVDYGLKFAGLDATGQYKFLNTAEHFMGLSAYWELDYLNRDAHSGLKKRVFSLESGLAAEKYFLEGQLIWAGNMSVKAVHATRAPLSAGRKRALAALRVDAMHENAAACANYDGRLNADLSMPDPAEAVFEDDSDDCFEWPTFNEMEVELKLGTGLSYRFAPSWFAGLEMVYEEEYETEVDRERYSLFAGPSLHYEGRTWGASLGWFRQLKGGEEDFPEQIDFDLHLIEKTKNIVRFTFSRYF